MAEDEVEAESEGRGMGTLALGLMPPLLLELG